MNINAQMKMDCSWLEIADRFLKESLLRLKILH